MGVYSLHLACKERQFFFGEEKNRCLLLPHIGLKSRKRSSILTNKSVFPRIGRVQTHPLTLLAPSSSPKGQAMAEPLTPLGSVNGVRHSSLSQRGKNTVLSPFLAWNRLTNSEATQNSRTELILLRKCYSCFYPEFQLHTFDIGLESPLFHALDTLLRR